MRALIWFVLAAGWGIDAVVSFYFHRNGNAALIAVIALIFSFIGWMVRRNDRRRFIR